ncbi:hypothetical protein BLNAU_1215 [Blattamonas nauphoetae]|uniref:Secreted protein n=1 Tax=Blattamonas nauphoetae TaxID=2049346 RepID=A0ABQ9YJ22_9EUKA|nr:hypothetical protein BLNAU_1215 [Blattamonas nauphoetae]
MSLCPQSTQCLMLGRRWLLVVHNTFFARADDVKSERGFASMMDKSGPKEVPQTDYQVVLTLCICLSEEEQIGSRVCAWFVVEVHQ